MKRLQAFKFELRANGGQQRQMRRFAGSCRFVYNKALAWQIAAYAKDRSVKFNYTNCRLNWRGGRLIVVPPQNTSRECPACGHVAAENRRTQDRFACIDCGYEEHADVVGAINILARGHRVAACGEEGSGIGFKLKTKTSSAKQEPTGETVRDAA